MFNITVGYKNFRNEDVERSLYFNLTETEVIEYSTSHNNGIDLLLDQIAKTKDREGILKLFKEFVLKSYGELSGDGEYFRKSEAISNDFVNSAAFNALFMKFYEDGKFAAEFVEKVIPKEYIEKINKQVIGNKQNAAGADIIAKA